MPDEQRAAEMAEAIRLAEEQEDDDPCGCTGWVRLPPNKAHPERWGHDE